MFSPLYESRVQYASLQQSDQRHDMSQVHPQPLLPPFTCRVYHQLLELLGTALGCLAFMAFIRCHRHLVPLCAARSMLPFVCRMRQVPPASGAPLCSVFLFLRGRYHQPLVHLCALCCLSCLSCARYHQFLVPFCALCFFSCAVGTTILWRHSVLYAAFLEHQVPPASGASLCSVFLFLR